MARQLIALERVSERSAAATMARLRESILFVVVGVIAADAPFARPWVQVAHVARLAADESIWHRLVLRSHAEQDFRIAGST
jgi:hypothetical protein